MQLTHENIRLFWILLVSSYKEVYHEEIKISFFPTYVPATLIKSKLQIHPLNPANPDILKVITKYL